VLGQTHNFESKDLRVAKAKQWPATIDFDLLHKQILRLHDFLRRLLTTTINKNEFFLRVKEDLGDNPARSNGIVNQFSSFNSDGQNIGAG